MGAKSILEIEVNDAQFKRFHELFSQYSDELDKMPESWRALGAAMGESTKEIEGGAVTAKEALALAAAQAGIIADALKSATKAQQALGDTTKASGKHMDGLRRSAEGVVKAISTLGGWIVKIGAIGGLSGLVSGVGIGELASAAFSRTRESGRLGLTPGALASFQIHAQQFLGASALEAAANAQIDATKAGYLAALHIGFGAAQRMSAGDLAFEELKRARAAYIAAKKTPAGPLSSPAVRAYLALGGDLGDVRNASLYSVAQLTAAQTNVRRGAGALEINEDARQKWSNLKIKLDEAGSSIQTALINKLTILAPRIETFATDISNFITQVLGSKNVGVALDVLEHGLKSLGDYLASPKVISDMKAFGNGISWIADKFHWITSTGNIDDKKKAENNKKNIAEWKALYNFPGAAKNWVVNELQRAQNFVGGAKATTSDVVKKISAAAKSYGVDPLLALATAINESGLNPRAVGDHGTSFGLFQLHRGGELGDLSKEQAFNASTNARRALVEFARVAKRHPNLSPGQIAALAQRPAEPEKYARNVNDIYNRLAAQMTDRIIKTIDDDVKKHGKNWTSYLPKDVAAVIASAHLSSKEKMSTDIPLINKALRAALMRRTTQKPMQVSITNSTAARVAVSMNAAAVS